MPLTRDAYRNLIQEDLAWLESVPRTLERDHVIAIVNASEDHEYGSQSSTEELTETKRKLALAEARVKELEEIARLIGSIFYHGNFKAETWNERELESRLKSAGFWFTSTEECLPRDPLDKAMPRKD